MKKGICKLCKKNKDLCKKSHIISNYLYKPLKGKDGEMFEINAKSNLNNPKKKFTGEFESELLCNSCESHLSRYETYGSDLFLNTKRVKDLNVKRVVNQNNIKAQTWSGDGYSYEKIKLLLLSILWRASISSRDFFKLVTLDSRTEEDLRKRIINKNSGYVYEYPILIILPSLVKNDQGVEGFLQFDIGLTMSPYKRNIGGIEVFEFTITGCTYQFAITKNLNNGRFTSINKDELVMLFMTEEQTRMRRNNIVEVLQKN